jgi:AraC-like DNA-binding protein
VLIHGHDGDVANRMSDMLAGRAAATSSSPRVTEQRAILVAAPVGTVRTHIAGALHHTAPLRFESDVAALNRLSCTVGPMAGLLYLDGSYDHGDALQWLAQVRQLRTTWTALPLIGYAPPTASAFQQGLRAARAGVDEIALQGSDTLRDVVDRLIATTTRRSMAAELLRHVTAVSAPLPADTLHVVRHCIEHARDCLTVDRLAHDVGMSRRTVAYRLKVARLPAPEPLIMWSRLLVAAWLLQDPHYPVNKAARALGWRELSALRSLSMNYLGHQPRLLRDVGAIARVATSMVAAGAADDNINASR